MNEAFNDEALYYDPPGRSPSRTRVIKALLLAVELLVVAALFAGALTLWQVRQDLHRELAAAQQLEAVLRAAERQAAQPALHRSKLALAGDQFPAFTSTHPPGAPALRQREAPARIEIEAIHGRKAGDHHR